MAYDESLSVKHVRTFDITDQSMKGRIMVDSKGLESAGDLQRWIDMGIEYANKLPVK